MHHMGQHIRIRYADRHTIQLQIRQFITHLSDKVESQCVLIVEADAIQADRHAARDRKYAMLRSSIMDDIGLM